SISARTPTLAPFPYTTLFRSRFTRTAWADSSLSCLSCNVGGCVCASTEGNQVNDFHKSFNKFAVAKVAVLDYPSNRVVTYRVKRSEEHTSELQSRENLVCRLL